MSKAKRQRAGTPNATTERADAAGRSAQREYERQRATRRARIRARYGTAGSVIAALAGEPRHVAVWQQGADGEAETARRLERHLRRTAVIVLHDRRVPGRGRANIDHLAIGTGGLTVIDTKSSRGRVQLTTVGFVRRREVLLVNGWDRTAELDKIEGQLLHVSERLGRHGVDVEGICGALCFPYMRRSWPHRSRVHGGLVIVDDPRHVAKLASRPGSLTADDITALTETVSQVFPPAVR